MDEIFNVPLPISPAPLSDSSAIIMWEASSRAWFLLNDMDSRHYGHAWRREGGPVPVSSEDLVG